MIQTQEKVLIAISVVLSVIVAVLLWALLAPGESSTTDGLGVEQNIEEEAEKGAVVDFEIPAGPALLDEVQQDAPSYLYLFTHTEDPFNHDLSEERYWRVGEMIRDAARAYPAAELTWTIEFQGSDAKTIADRNEETGLVEYLLELKDEGLVEFGYHAHHDPTYQNRPQNRLPSNPTYEEAYDALWSWITCVKDVNRGGCIEERGGGLEAIYETFGQVEIVTGLGLGEGTQIERSAGSQAVRELLPGRYLGFGFPDHGAVIKDPAYAGARDALLEILTPTHETSSGTLWMDNAIRINDAASLEGIDAEPLKEGSASYERELKELDGTRSIVINAGIASKYLYTASGTSPTKWGYVNADSPELPDELVLSPKEQEKAYQLTKQGLEYLAQQVNEDPDALQFVSSNDVVNLFMSADYVEVDEEELYQMALWVLNNWDGAPPSWVYDGEDFYSLADTFALLARGLNGEFEQTAVVSEVYGPWSLSQIESEATTVSVDELRTLATTDLYTDWRMKEQYEIGDVALTSAQVLYAWSYLFAANQAQVDITHVPIPEMQSAPETYELLETLGCHDCLDTTWSLKPARFQD